MADFYTVEGVLASAVADAGTFTFGWPSGSRLGSFRSGKNHKLLVNQTLYVASTDFTVAYTSATVITITWNGGYTLAAGSEYRVQLDVGGDTPVTLDDGSTVNNAAVLTPLRINLGAPITPDTDGIATGFETTAGAADLTLDGVQSAAGVATLDVPRNVTLTGTDSATDLSSVTFTITGADEYGDVLVETIAGPNGTATTAGKKAFKTVTTARAGAAVAGGVNVGFGDILGLPVFVDAVGILKEREDGASATAGTLVAGLSALTKSTATTADVRGTYDPNSACNGAKVFELDVLVADPKHLGNPQYAG